MIRHYITSPFDDFRKKLSKALLQRFLGPYLKGSLSLNQLTLELIKGTLSIKDLELNVDTLNSLSDQFNLPTVFIDGRIKEINVSVPWKAVLCESSFVEIDGLCITVQPKVREDEVDIENLVGSMMDSMTTSLQMAHELIEKDIENADDDLTENITSQQSSEAVQSFANGIDNFFTLIKVRFLNTIIRVEYAPKNSKNKVAIEIRIKQISYLDEAASAINKGNNDKDDNGNHFTTKTLFIEGVDIYSEEILNEDSTVNSPMSSQSPSDLQDILHNYSEQDSLYEEDQLIQFAKMCGRHEMKIKLRQSHDISGPKFEIELCIGTLYMFLTPRQVYQLLELIEGFNPPENENKCKKAKHMPMGQEDYRRFESELERQIHKEMVPTEFDNNYGWSGNDDDEQFYPMGSNNDSPFLGNMNASDISMTSDLATSFDSTYGLNVKPINHSISQHMRYTGAGVIDYSPISPLPYNKKPVKLKTTKDKSSEKVDYVSSIKIAIGTCVGILTHEDVLTLSPENGLPTKISVKDLNLKADTFFSKVSEKSLNNLKIFRNNVSSSCSLSHISLIAGPLSIDISEKNFSKTWKMTTEVLVGSIDLIECLIETGLSGNKRTTTELIYFEDENFSEHSLSKFTPNFKVNLIQSTKSGLNKRKSTLDVQIELTKCQSEVDISIIDRISHVLTKIPILERTKVYSDFTPSFENESYFNRIEPDAIKKVSNSTSIEIKANLLLLKIRFPIPDLRPNTDISRLPWWKQNLRNDILTLCLKDMTFQTSLDPQNSNSTASYEIKSEDIHILFQERETDQPVSLLRAYASPGSEKGFNTPRIMIFTTPIEKLTAEAPQLPMSTLNSMTTSFIGFVDDPNNENTCPFINNKRTLFKGRTEGFLIPKKGPKLLEFIDITEKDSQIQVNLYVPEAQLILPSKHLLEVVYNRLATDLLLWVPSSPKFKFNPTNEKAYVNADHAPSFGSYDTFEMYKSKPCEEQFYSCFDTTKSKPVSKINESLPTWLSLNISLGHCSISMMTPCRDTKGNVLPGCHGEFCLKLDEGTIFVASGYKGKENQLYNIILAKKVALYHCSTKVTPDEPWILDLTKHRPISQLNKILYPNDKDVYTKLNVPEVQKNKETFDMVTFIIEMDFDEETNVKTNRIAGGLRGMTLRHFVTPNSISWISQILDMFEIQDYSVDGYTLPNVITHLNFTLNDFGIDYRPINIPIRSFVTIDSFSISTSLSQTTEESQIIFILENAGLFVSNILNSNTVDLINNYVCVVDVGLFEIIVNIGKKDALKGNFIVSLSNDKINVRTCSDSLAALLELLIYVSSDGDLVREATENMETNNGTEEIKPSLPDELYKKDSDCNQSEVISDLMMDAMAESIAKEDQSTDDVEMNTNDNGINKVFFFPDEVNSDTNVPNRYNSPPLLKDKKLSDLNDALSEVQNEYFSDHMDDADDEFCILDEEFFPDTRTGNKRNVPRVKALENTRENKAHKFYKNLKEVYDEMEAPKNFPIPLITYVLKELNLNWIIYSGNDFKHANVNKHESPNTLHSNISVNHKSGTVSYTPSLNNSSNNSLKPGMHSSPLNQRRNFTSWQAVGGKYRNHDIAIELKLKKVRFEYNEYPKDCKQAYRHILLINEIEIIDWVKISNIKTMLNQYASAECPKRGNGSMVMVKCVTSRSGTNNEQEESSLLVSIRPIRLNIDQDTLIFLLNTCDNITNLLIDDNKKMYHCNEERVVERNMPACINTPVCTVIPNITTRGKQQQLVTFEDCRTNVNDTHSLTRKKKPKKKIYFKYFKFHPECRIRIDYHGKYVIDTASQHGTLISIVMGFGQLNNSQLILKQFIHKSGLLGIDRLISYVIDEWATDIKGNQLPSILSGVGPMNSVVQLVNGFFDFFRLPFEQYKKDGRMIRGIQRGTSAFSTATAHAALDLTGRFISAIQTTAETMYDMVSYGPSAKTQIRYRNSGNPQDIREGVTQALYQVQIGFSESANTVLSSIEKEHEEKGVTGIVGEVLRQIPPNAVRPVILVTGAASAVIEGIKNQVIPEARQEASEKWKS